MEWLAVVIPVISTVLDFIIKILIIVISNGTYYCCQKKK